MNMIVSSHALVTICIQCRHFAFDKEEKSDKDLKRRGREGKNNAKFR